jgi:predicted transcriptional regulator
MPQLTIYLDDETAKDLEKRAKTGKLSKSRVVADALKETNRQHRDAEIRKKLAEMCGSIPDFPSLEEIRGTMWTEKKS